MRIYAALSFAAFCAIAAFSVWFGALNQDEGWYIYASSLVSEGQMPYRDFFYTQGPLMPFVYSVFAPLWKTGGILAARLVTLSIGLLGILANASLARSLVDGDRGKKIAGLVVFILLACNLYHVYYTTIPKTYALAGLFASFGILLSARAAKQSSALARLPLFFFSGVSMAFSSGVRVSMLAMILAAGAMLLFSRQARKSDFLFFFFGAAGGLAFLYLPFVLDADALAGLLEAQKYHAARKGFSPMLLAGSLSRLVRWYLPVFVLAGLFARHVFKECSFSSKFALVAFSAVFVLQQLAPFPYEDYQVPLMGVFAAIVAGAAARAADGDAAEPRSGRMLLLAVGMTFACSFGSPLAEGWMTDGQDRIWPLVRRSSALSELRRTAKFINELDPGGKTILTQDLYLAVETGRKVPHGLEMGPFSILSDDEWCELLATADCPVAALSGYTFAIDPPECTPRELGEQLGYWAIVKSRYVPVKKVPNFGQNSTPLAILTRK